MIQLPLPLREAGAASTRSINPVRGQFTHPTGFWQSMCRRHRYAAASNSHREARRA